MSGFMAEFLLRTTGLAVLLIGCANPMEIQAQSPPGAVLPQFELASIKPQPWTNEGAVDVYVRGNTLYGEHADLYLLVDFAYGLRTDNLQVSGGPEWSRHGVLSNEAGFDSVLFQVIARAPDGPAPAMEQFRLMLQALLADRFQLRIHHATKDLPVFNLLLGKDGPKFRENTSDANAVVTAASESGSDGRGFRMSAVHVPLAKLVEELTFAVDRPVIDKTGLAGFYDFETAWSPRFLRDDLTAAGGADDVVPDTRTPSLFTAVQRLGLKLERSTAPYDTVVIDHAEKPSGN
jgi:uncharacterized protein (TIGR03435 family)